MLVKSDSNSSAAMAVCGNCGAEERRLLHQVRHRSVFRRLCTSCVLRLHPQAFCPTCFEVYPPTLPNDVVRTCVKCYSHSHSHCVAPPPNPYVCPLCVSPSAPIFKLKPSTLHNCRLLDRDAARMLLAAAKIASSSMNKAAVAARAEAERRVKEAAYTRKRAKEALEHVAHLLIKEKARRKEAAFDLPGRPNFTPPPAKMPTDLPATVAVTPPFVAVPDNVSNVDRDNSNRVLAALNAVELRESEKMAVVGLTAKGEGSLVAPMDVDDAVNVGENDMETDAGEKIGGLNNEVALVKKKGADDGVNGGPA